jgi:hypothetical protein
MLVETAHSQALTVFFYLLAFIPILAAVLMLLVVMYAFYVMFSRRESIKLTLDLRNKDVFDSYGIKISPSDNYDWIVIEIRNKSPGMVQNKIKIPAAKPTQSAPGTPAPKDTSQGLLGHLEGVDIDDDRL